MSCATSFSTFFLICGAMFSTKDTAEARAAFCNLHAEGKPGHGGLSSHYHNLSDSIREALQDFR